MEYAPLTMLNNVANDLNEEANYCASLARNFAATGNTYLSEKLMTLADRLFSNSQKIDNAVNNWVIIDMQRSVESSNNMIRAVFASAGLKVEE